MSNRSYLSVFSDGDYLTSCWNPDGEEMTGAHPLTPPTQTQTLLLACSRAGEKHYRRRQLWPSAAHMWARMWARAWEWAHALPTLVSIVNTLVSEPQKKKQHWKTGNGTELYIGHPIFMLFGWVIFTFRVQFILLKHKLIFSESNTTFFFSFLC